MAAAARVGGEDVADAAGEEWEAAAVKRFGDEEVVRRVLQCEDVCCRVVQDPCQLVVLYVKAERGE
jgi:hypothetical protein